MLKTAIKSLLVSGSIILGHHLILMILSMEGNSTHLSHS